MEDRYVKRKRIGYITRSEKNWSKEFSIIQWRNNDEEMFDIRKWKYDDEGVKVGKGISLTRAELIKLQAYISEVLGKSEDIDIPLNLD